MVYLGSPDLIASLTSYAFNSSIALNPSSDYGYSLATIFNYSSFV